MSHVTVEKPIKLNIGNGIVIGCLLKILDQKHSGRKVIFDFKALSTNDRFTVGLDNNDFLSIWYIDKNGTESCLTVKDRAKYYDKEIFGCFSLEEHKNNHVLCIYLLDFDGSNLIDAKQPIQLNSGEYIEYRFTMGASFDLLDHAAMTLAEVFLYSRKLDENEKRGLLFYIKEKRGF